MTFSFSFFTNFAGETQNGITMKRDRHIFQLIETEYRRQLKGIELIASENFVSDEVMKAMGSVLTNKYAEGYPGKRYYGGCSCVDVADREPGELQV